MGVLHSLMPWWPAGPLLGLCVVVLYALGNRHLGAPQPAGAVSAGS
jgi:hypothetical protein